MKENNWEKFWDAEIAVNSKKMKAFSQNFNVMKYILLNHFDSLKGKTALEVGCGRGTISKFLMAEGVETTGIDSMKKFKYFNDNFIEMDFVNSTADDIFDLIMKSGGYDIVFTYGLLEHFRPKDVGTIGGRCKVLCKTGGIIIHYCVPSKLTNIFENSDVFRHNMRYMNHIYDNVTWTYPVFDVMTWRTNKWFGKGFFVWETK